MDKTGYAFKLNGRLQYTAVRKICADLVRLDLPRLQRTLNVNRKFAIKWKCTD